MENHMTEARIPVADKFATVSQEDYAAVSQHRWSLVPSPSTEYASARIGGRNVYMHRFVMGEPDGVIDHKNRDGLDNRRENLRVCTQSQNIAASKTRPSKSGARGVHRHGRKWRAVLSKNDYVGSFDTIEEAIAARNAAALARWGEFAVLA